MFYFNVGIVSCDCRWYFQYQCVVKCEVFYCGTVSYYSFIECLSFTELFITKLSYNLLGRETVRHVVGTCISNHR